jgi:hypothetical protein
VTDQKGNRYRLARERTLALHEQRTRQPWSDRFVVSEVTGYPIPANGTSGDRQPSTIWYVNDTAYAHAVVAEFRSSGEDNGALRARRHARWLNMRDWEADRS